MRDFITGISKSKYNPTSMATIVLLIFFAGVTVYANYRGMFLSVDAFRTGISNLGIYGALVFVLLQTVQVIVPVIPNPVVCVAGVLIFNPFYGFIYSYIGICIGSLIAFWLAKNYGVKIIERLFSEKLLDKYKNWTEGNGFTMLFAGAIACPGMPDDFLCYLAGTSRIRTLHFLMIILVGRAIMIMGYSLFLNLFYTVPII